jgi:hypothetical protein
VGVKIVFAIIAHSRTQDLERLIRVLLTQEHLVVVHFDRKSAAEGFQGLQGVFGDNPSVRFAKRVNVHWGEWSVVQAEINCLEAIEASGWRPDYVYLMSGTDYPVRPSSQLVSFLERNKGCEYIQSVPGDVEKWVKTGPQRERYLYHWFFNWRENKRSDFVMKMQQKLGLERPFVRRFTPYLGSQWWVLTWRTLTGVLKLARERDIKKFFRTTLVPDELFFQTLVRRVVAAERIMNRTLTLTEFSDYGFPCTYQADHYDYLTSQNFFMARKINLYDTTLRDRLDLRWAGQTHAAPVCDSEVGLKSPGYEDWRLAFRNGPPGRPVAGLPQGRYFANHRPTNTPYFVVIGGSTTELRLVFRLISCRPELLCHGQIFHPARIEFANNAEQFAGYRAIDIKMRDVSHPDFLTDLIAGERRRMSGMLLPLCQGYNVPDATVTLPNVRVVFVPSDPLIAFAENLLHPLGPLLSQPLDLQALQMVPPAMAALRYRRFLSDHAAWVRFMDDKLEQARQHKPLKWALKLADNLGEWPRELQDCFGLPLQALGSEGYKWQSEASQFGQYRTAVTELLLRGGVSEFSIDLISNAGTRADLALALA